MKLAVEMNLDSPRVQGIVLTGMSASSTQRAALARGMRWDRSRVELRLFCCGHGACGVPLTLQIINEKARVYLFCTNLRVN